MTTKNVLGIITARGGSKGLPGKNIRPFAGLPLIAHTILTALAAKPILTSLVVSTDDMEIAEVCRSYGADVPFLRPMELSGDDVASVPVLQHATAFMETAHNTVYDWIVTLQPTSPLRTVKDLTNLIEMALNDPTVTAVVNVCEASSSHPHKMKKIVNGNLISFMDIGSEGLRRQDYKPVAYKTNGAGYITRRDVLMDDSSLLGEKIVPAIMPEERSIDIDSLLDFRLAELIKMSGPDG